MSRRRRRPEEPPHHPGKQLTLNEIKFLTCESLDFPYDLSCFFCKPKISVIENTRRCRKTFRAKLEQNRCDQFWDEKWVKNDNTSGQIKKHTETRNYLPINVETTLEEIGYESTPRRRKLHSGVSPAPPGRWRFEVHGYRRKCWDVVTCVQYTRGGFRIHWFAYARHRRRRN